MKTIKLDLNGVKTTINLYVNKVDVIPQNLKAVRTVKSFLAPGHKWAMVYVNELPTPENKEMIVSILASEKADPDNFNYQEFSRKMANTILRSSLKAMKSKEHKHSAMRHASFYRTLLLDRIESELFEDYIMEGKAH